MKEEDRLKIINKIKYELQKGTHTFTMCSCGRNGCRGILCWECLLEMLK